MDIHEYQARGILRAHGVPVPPGEVASTAAEAEAIALANNTNYGLGSGLWTNNLQRAHRVADAIDAGMVWINSYKRVHPGSPFGGVGQSGYGRDLGVESLSEYTEPKSIEFRTTVWFECVVL